MNADDARPRLCMTRYDYGYFRFTLKGGAANAGLDSSLPFGYWVRGPGIETRSLASRLPLLSAFLPRIRVRHVARNVADAAQRNVARLLVGSSAHTRPLGDQPLRLWRANMRRESC